MTLFHHLSPVWLPGGVAGKMKCNSLWTCFENCSVLWREGFGWVLTSSLVALCQEKSTSAIEDVSFGRTAVWSVRWSFLALLPTLCSCNSRDPCISASPSSFPGAPWVWSETYLGSRPGLLLTRCETVRLLASLSFYFLIYEIRLRLSVSHGL